MTLTMNPYTQYDIDASDAHIDEDLYQDHLGQGLMLALGLSIAVYLFFAWLVGPVMVGRTVLAGIIILSAIGLIYGTARSERVMIASIVGAITALIATLATILCFVVTPF